MGGVGEAVAGRLGARERVDGAGAVTRARRRAGAGNLAGDSSVAEIALTHSSFRSRSGVGVGPSVDRAAAVARAHHAAAVRGAGDGAVDTSDVGAAFGAVGRGEVSTASTFSASSDTITAETVTTALVGAFLAAVSFSILRRASTSSVTSNSAVTSTMSTARKTRLDVESVTAKSAVSTVRRNIAVSATT